MKNSKLRTICKACLVRPEFILLASILVLYLITSPVTVQSGDTGELVTNAYHLRVAHPPGYPLWTLLYHLPVRHLNFGNPFHAASIFSIIISMISLGVLVVNFKEKGQLLLIAVLATSLLFWRYAVQPDVFALHALFLTLVFLCFVFPEFLTRPWIIFLVSLGVANHHTIVFAFPLFLYALLQKPDRKRFFYSTLFGLLSLGLYFLLFAFHPNDYGSWDNVTSIDKLLNHFLRKEYGTFRLQVKEETNGSWVMFFLEHLFLSSWSLIVTLGYLLVKHFGMIKANRNKMGVLAFTIIAYFIAFTSMGGMSLHHSGEAVFERFLIHPILLLFFLALMLLAAGGIQLPKLIMICLLINIGTNLVKNYPTLNYRKNSSIEDYLRNALNSVPQNGIYYTFGDIDGFGTYYLKDVLNLRPDVIHIHPTWGFGWGREKLKKAYPELILSTDPYIFKSINFERHRFFTNYVPYTLPEDKYISFYGLLFEIGNIKSGETFKRFLCGLKYTWQQRPELEDFAEFEIGRSYDLTYGKCHFTMGLEALAAKDMKNAEDAFLNALKLSPFNGRYQERLCHLYHLTGKPELKTCEERLEALLTVSHQQYFVEKKD